MAVLLSKILGIEASVGDVHERAAGDISSLGIKFSSLICLRTTRRHTRRSTSWFCKK